MISRRHLSLHFSQRVIIGASIETRVEAVARKDPRKYVRVLRLDTFVPRFARNGFNFIFPKKKKRIITMRGQQRCITQIANEAQIDLYVIATSFPFKTLFIALTVVPVSLAFIVSTKWRSDSRYFREYFEKHIGSSHKEMKRFSFELQNWWRQSTWACLRNGEYMYIIVYSYNYCN